MIGGERQNLFLGVVVSTAIYLSLSIVAIAMIVAVLLQVKGSLGGSIFGGESMYTSRRGAEKTLFNVTIGLSVAFILLDLLAFFYAR